MEKEEEFEDEEFEDEDQEDDLEEILKEDKEVLDKIKKLEFSTSETLQVEHKSPVLNEGLAQRPTVTQLASGLNLEKSAEEGSWVAKKKDGEDKLYDASSENKLYGTNDQDQKANTQYTTFADVQRINTNKNIQTLQPRAAQRMDFNQPQSMKEEYIQPTRIQRTEAIMPDVEFTHPNVRKADVREYELN